jgi:hypothetical protein
VANAAALVASLLLAESANAVGRLPAIAVAWGLNNADQLGSGSSTGPTPPIAMGPGARH